MHGVCVEFRWVNTIFAACVVSLHTCNLFFLFVLCIMQLKAYARFQGKPTTWDKKDMVFVSLGYAYDEDITEHVVLPRSQTGERLMLAAFVCLNVLIGLILMWLTIAYYETFWEKLGAQGHDPNKKLGAQGHDPNKKLGAQEHDPNKKLGAQEHDPNKKLGAQEHDPNKKLGAKKHDPNKIKKLGAQEHDPNKIEKLGAQEHDPNKKLGAQGHDSNKKTVQKSLYQATVLVFCCANIFNFGVFVTACLFKHPNFDTADEVVITAFTLKMVMIPVLIFSHLLVIVFVVFGVPKTCHKRSGSTEPLESQSQRPAQKQVISKVLQVLALFNILIFIQTIASAFIPLFVYLLLYTYRVLSALIFMASGAFCLIVFVANLLHYSAAKNCRYILVLFLQAFILLAFLAFICVLVVFYLLLLSHGLHTGGLQGFLLSLLPSAVISAAGWYVKAKVLNSKSAT